MKDQNSRLLIVEDESEVRESLKEILELMGFDVSTANDGVEGREKILADKPDLVLCDVNMPRMSGFELLEEVNELMEDQIPPAFLFLTARVDRDDIRFGLNLGAEDYILKPFDHAELLKSIKLRLDKRTKLLNHSGRGEEMATDSVLVTDGTLGSDKLAIPVETGLDLIEFSNIIRCQAERAYCNFFLVDGRSILVSRPLKDFEATLEARGFIRVHKSNLVNLSHIRRYVKGKGGYLVLSDGSHVMVSIRKRERLLSILKG